MSLGIAAAAAKRTHQVVEEDGGMESVNWRIRPAQVAVSPEGAVTVVMLLPHNADPTLVMGSSRRAAMLPPPQGLATQHQAPTKRMSP